MIETKIINIGNRELIETTTTEPDTKKLLQIETNKVYYEKAVDVIIAGKSTYTYQEIGKTLEDLERDRLAIEMTNIMGGNI